MVRKGDFSACLVEAEAKTKFQEHSKGEETYVEVEPDVEYYIRIQSFASKPVTCYFFVDGQDLGYNSTIGKKCGPVDRGLWSRRGNKSIQQALRFAKTPVMTSNAESSNGETPFWTGKVEVRFYEAKFVGWDKNKKRDASSSWKKGNVGYVIGVSDPTKKKGIMAEEGSKKEIKELSSESRRAKYSSGQLLQTITLNYCSALGLIYAGVLPKPPAWDLHRMSNPRKRNRDDEEEEEVKPEIVEQRCPMGGPTKTHEVFDLTGE